MLFRSETGDHDPEMTDHDPRNGCSRSAEIRTCSRISSPTITGPVLSTPLTPTALGLSRSNSAPMLPHLSLNCNPQIPLTRWPLRRRYSPYPRVLHRRPPRPRPIWPRCEGPPAQSLLTLLSEYMAPGLARRGARVPVRSSGRMLQAEMSQKILIL